MDNDVNKVLNRIKTKREIMCEEKEKKSFKYLKRLITRILLCIIFTFSALIYVNYDNKNLTNFKNVVFEEYFDFSKINNIYTKYLGSILPFEKVIDEKVVAVFNEKFTYQDYEEYLDGYKLLVQDNYLVPVLQTGVVVFIGEKEGYGNTIIIEGIDGVDIWYANIKNINLELYDYVLKGSLLGDIEGNSIYLVLKKDGKTINIDEYSV